MGAVITQMWGVGQEAPSVIIIGIVVYVVGYIFFYPTIVANRRRHNHVGIIFLINLFCGGSFVGWVVVLIWAYSKDVRPDPA